MGGGMTQNHNTSDPVTPPHTCPAMGELEARFHASSERMQRLEQKIDGNSADTREVLDILHAGKGFFRVVGWIGNVVKWAAAIGAPLIAFYYAVKQGPRL
jgi:hypothetical protein